MFEANRRFFTQSFALGPGRPSASAAGRKAVVSAADRGAGERRFIWPLAATVMLVLLVWAVATELRLPPEQRAAIFAIQSQAYP
jgi:hypothetical protein